MAFDPLSWITGYALSRIANKVFSPRLENELLREIQNWARERAGPDSVVPEALLPVLTEDEERHHPAFTKLYSTLCEPSVPAIEEWNVALVERYTRLASVHPDPQPFFKLPFFTAEPLLAELATRLHRVCTQDDRLFKTYVIELQQRMLEQLQESHYTNSSSFPASHTPIHHAVLQKLSEGFKGAGVHDLTEHMGREQAACGTLMLQWRLGSQSPQMMLVDYVGGVFANRVSLILEQDSSVILRVYDSAGQEHRIRSRPYVAENELICFVTWQDATMTLRINGEEVGSLSFKPFEYLGPLILFGIDIEGTLSADAVRWSINDDEPGLCFRKDGIWHGSVWRQALLWCRLLSEADQSLFLDDPLVMYRLKDGTLALPERKIGNIDVVVPSELEDVLDLGRISEAEIATTVNDRHRGMLIPGNPPLIGAIHWFSDDPVLVIAEVSQWHREGEKLKIEQVTCKLALRFANTLPTGQIDQWMKFGPILETVAESFGLPVVCSKSRQPAKFHIDADWDGNVEVLGVDKATDVCVFGVFDQDERKCHCVWAFSLDKYRHWITKGSQTAATKGASMTIDKEGSITFCLRHEHKDWHTNNHAYNFGIVEGSGVRISALKYPDKTVEITIDGPFKQSFTFRQQLPECDERGLFVAVTWKDNSVNLFLNGEAVKSQKGE